MKVDIEHIRQWIERIASLITAQEDPAAHYYSHFIQEPELASVLIDLLAEQDEKEVEQDRSYYSACIFALDVCVAQLQSAQENGNKHAEKTMQQVMETLANAIRQHTHTLMYWLPVLNAFYDVHAELSESLKDAYLTLVDEEDERVTDDGATHLNSIRELIDELSDLTVFDIAENFFAQSYAMPADFFNDLVVDLYSIDVGQDIGLLALLHPEYEVREVVVATLDALMPYVTLSSKSLSRLQSIASWYPAEYYEQLNRWIKDQRKKGVIFQHDAPAEIVKIHASEVDGGGAQGLFIHLKRGRIHRLCGLLLKDGIGIKDAWMTSDMSTKDVTRYYAEVFDDSVMLREIDMTYLHMITNHFLALTIEQHGMPDLHLLEIQEEMGIHFLPKKMNQPLLMNELGVQIAPFTPEILQASLKRSKSWAKTKRFTESWYLENAHVDKLVNRCCHFVDGVRVCRVEEAKQHVFLHEMEQNRERWIFHFLWIALWLKSKARKNEKMWQDSFLIAHEIQAGTPLSDIPIMQEICQQSVLHSVETMHERRTHLSQE